MNVRLFITCEDYH